MHMEGAIIIDGNSIFEFILMFSNFKSYGESYASKKRNDNLIDYFNPFGM